MLILGIFLGAIILVFFAQNLDTVSYDFLFWSAEAPRSIVFLFILVTGMILGWLIKTFARRRKKKQ